MRSGRSPVSESAGRLRALIGAACLALSALVSPARAQSPPPSQTTIPADIELRVREWLTRAEPFGISGAIAILRDTSMTLLAGFGPLGPDGGRIGPDTPFLLASLSKQFTAAAILRSAADGHLSLDDSIGRFFPDAPSPQRAITVRQLLSHTAGMVYLEPGMFDPAPDRAKLMRELVSLPLDFTPGTRYSYSNPGYAVLGGILEQAEYRPFQAVMTARIFEPAGMAGTTYMGRPVNGAPHGIQLGVDQGPMSDIPGIDRAVGNGSIVSTARDLARWEVALRTHRVLDEHWTTELFTPRAPTVAGAQYAFGWNVQPTPRGTTLIHHAGDLGPFNAEFRRYIDDGLTLIWLSNARLASGGTRDVVTRVVANLLNGVTVTAPPAVGTRDRAAERLVAGRYLLTGGDTLVVTADTGHLTIGATGSAAVLALGGGMRDTTAAAETIASALGALRSGDSVPFQQRLHPAIGAANAIAGTRNFLQSLADSLGSPLRFDPVGAIPGTPGRGTAWVRISGPKGSTVAGFGLAGGGRIIAFADPTDEAAPTTLLHSAEHRGQYMAFDPATMRTTRVAFDRAGLTLTVGDAAPVTARRLRS